MDTFEDTPPSGTGVGDASTMHQAPSGPSFIEVRSSEHAFLTVAKQQRLVHHASVHRQMIRRLAMAEAPIPSDAYVPALGMTYGEACVYQILGEGTQTPPHPTSAST